MTAGNHALSTGCIRNGLLIATVGLVALLGLLTASPAMAAPNRDGYIVVFRDSVEHPGHLAHAQADRLGGEVGFVYRHALSGYSVTLPRSAADAIARNPRVAYVEPDARGGVAAQTTPTGINRIFAPTNSSIDIDAVEDSRVDVDIAIFDTGIDAEHPDLNVVSQVDCSNGPCTAGGTDGFGHGTHVAGIAAAIDNGEGVVGVAPGARLWSVKVLDNQGAGELSELIAGIDWVTARAGQIEVTNASLRYLVTGSQAFNEAIEASNNAGIVNVAAAGNEHEAVKYLPGVSPKEITVSALQDLDGTASGGNDPLAGFSNFGAAVDVVAPGVEILSTVPGGGYEGIGWSGTSMASPHVAGAAALLASADNPENAADVAAIRTTILSEGNLNWNDTSGDGVKEPLLDVSDAVVFDPVFKPLEPPTNTALPVISPAVPGVGVTETASEGSWAGDPAKFKYTYQWKRCNAAGAECTDISGAVLATYKPVAADLAKTLRVAVTAENIAGKATATSNATSPVQPAWTPKFPTPEVAASSSELQDVSCTTTIACTAVGTYVPKSETNKHLALATRWNGTEWKAQSVPQPGVNWSVAGGVYCLSAEKCILVGISREEVSGLRVPLAALWNGSTWTLQSVPVPVGAVYTTINDISCASSSECIAVGHTTTNASLKGMQPYIVKWNGSSWSQMTASLPTGGSGARLNDISCTSSSSCVAVGSYYKVEGEAEVNKGGFVETWNGTKWTGVGVGSTTEAFEAVSCSSSTSCLAVTVGTVWRLSGTEWKEITAPGIPVGSSSRWLKGVTCVSSTNCTAVGYSVESIFPTKAHVFISVWNGTGWIQQTAIGSPSVGTGQSLSGVSCAEALKCIAVGVHEYQSIAEHSY